jgi:BirA family biotin operon repressor/biotin-[acetyl-CoA-carboxylase] ligase
VIDVAKIRAESFASRVEWFEEIDSTNNRALQLAEQDSIELPLLIGAERQTSGRGRGANVWWGAEGSLMFSILAEMSRLALSQSDWPKFSLVTAIAVADTIAQLLPPSRIGVKWPNDVWVDRKKVCGILIEQSDRQTDRLVIGIGLNVNNSFESAPEDQRRIAISLRDARGAPDLDRTELLVRFLNIWRSLVEDLSARRINLAERWSRLCVLSGNPVALAIGNREIVGVCDGIADDGSLRLRTAFATEQHYAGTVRLLG